MSEKTLALEGAIVSKTIVLFKNFFLGVPPFEDYSVFVDSCGGYGGRAFEIAKLIALRQEEFCNTMNSFGGERVDSAAVILYLLGYKRSALPETSFLFHRARPGKEFTGEEVEIFELEKRMVSLFVERTGTPEETFWNLMDNNTRISSTDARALGIVNSYDQYPAILR